MKKLIVLAALATALFSPGIAGAQKYQTGGTAAPGGSNSELQYNAANTMGGVAYWTTDGSNLFANSLDAGAVLLSVVPQEALAEKWRWPEMGFVNNQVQGSTHTTITVDTLSTNVKNENWLAGATITDADGDIPGGTTITSVASNGLSITLSQAATGSHTGDTFTVSGARENQVLYQGWNLAISSGNIGCNPSDLADGCAAWGVESHWINNSGHPQVEWHQILYNQSGTGTRWLDASEDLIANTVGVTFTTDTLNFADRTSAVHATWNFDTPLFTITDPVQLNGNVTFGGSKTVTFNNAISGSPTWTGSPTIVGDLGVQNVSPAFYTGQLVTGGTSAHGSDALTATMLANGSGLSITGVGGSFTNPTLTFLTKTGPIGQIRIAGGGEASLYVGGTSASGASELSGGVLVGADINGGATFPYMIFGTSTIQFNNVSGGTASKYVCTDSSNNIVIQAGAC